MEIRWWCKTCGETFERMRFKCPKCGDGIYQYRPDRDAEKLALAQAGKVTPALREEEKKNEKAKLIKFVAGFVIVLVIVVAVLVTLSSTPPRSERVAIWFYNERNEEVRLEVTIDEEYQGYDYLSAGDDGLYFFDGFDPNEEHDISIYSDGLIATHRITLPPGKSLSFWIHQDGDATFDYY